MIQVVIRKSKKSLKKRGHREQGYGGHKKHRGKGSRGGRGNANLHKHKWSYTVKYEPDHYGKRGFKQPVAASKSRRIRAVNVGLLVMLAGGKNRVELKDFGYNKVLGTGKIDVPIEVVAESFSKKAVEKIEAAGGKAIVLEKKMQPAPSQDSGQTEQELEQNSEPAGDDV